MGLAEKKQIRSIEENSLLETKKKLNAILDKDIEISINWDSFETVAQLQEVEHQCLRRITVGIEKVASDAMGKEALQESLDAIQVNNIEDGAAKKITFTNNILTVDAKWEDYSAGIFTSDDYSTQIENLL